LKTACASASQLPKFHSTEQKRHTGRYAAFTFGRIRRGQSRVDGGAAGGKPAARQGREYIARPRLAWRLLDRVVKHLLSFLALMWLCSGCAFSAAPPVPLSAVVSAGVVAEQNLIEWQVTSNVPLTRAQLLLGLDGPRTPLDVPLPSGGQPLVFKYSIPSDGLHLSPGLNELRYGLVLTGTHGGALRMTGVLTSPRLIVDDSVADFQWQEARDGNLLLFYLPGTPAARDIEALRTTARISLARDSGVLGANLNQPLAIYLLPRIFWQGGAAFGDRIVMVSYADRAYTGVGPQDYLTHEIAHVLTQSWGNLTTAGGMLSEGIAVYATGGHYQPDRLDRSAATLVQGPLFIPPAILRRDFSNLQHEVAYTESGSFVKYLVDQFGLDNLRALIRRPNDWHALYGADIDVLSQRWLDRLHALAVDELEAQRWHLKVRFFDVLRQYEQRIDPDARRLPSVPVARWDAGLRGALRGPAEAEENQVLELMLGAVIDMIETAPGAEQLSRAAENLDEVERQTGQTPGDKGPAIAEVRSIVRLAQSQSGFLQARDWQALRDTLDESGHPLFAAQYLALVQSQPLWLRFRLAPVRLVILGADAYLTVAQWTEPFETSTPVASNGERWVLALQNSGGTWHVTGRWPESPEVLTARGTAGTTK